MNNRGQFSIIAALLITIILVSTVMLTYTAILNNSIQVQPQVLTAIDEINFALKQILGFSIGYYGSVIRVTGDNSFAYSSTLNYTSSGLIYIANTHPDWGAGFSLTNLTVTTYWFNGTSYSQGFLSVTYNLTKLGIFEAQYAPSCELMVQIANTTANNQTSLVVTGDQNEPVTDLTQQNFQFFQYSTNSTWTLISPTTSPIAFTNGTYQIQPPAGIDANSYVVQVTDQRGIIVVASPYSSYNINMTWPTPSTNSSSTNYYVSNDASDVDSNGNMGTVSNFTAQQYGPNNIYDTLTEGDVPVISGSTQYVQTNNQQHDTDVGTESNFSAEQSASNNYDNLTEANNNGASVSYVSITLTNTQSSATPNPFQEEISWNPSSYQSFEASNLGNIRFYNNSALTQPLYAWLESCTPLVSNTATSAVAWVKLTNPIAANGGTATIYMAFLSTSTNFDGNYWGEAPNLSGTYAAYDNGANVFNAYFNGNTATSSFSVYTGDTLSKATGVTGPGGTTINAIQVTGSTGGHLPAFVFNQTMGNTALIAESSFCLAGDTGDETGAVGLVDNTTAKSIKNAISSDMGFGGDYFNQAYEVGGTVTMPVNGQGTSTSNWVYASVTYPGSAASSWSAYIAPQLYSSTGGYSGTYSNNPLGSVTNIYLGQLSGSAAIDVYYNFVRARAYPPNNVMPSVSFGSISPTPNYQLDLEQQWTTAPYNANSSKLLCIETGAFSTSEALEVDVWNGAWVVLNSSLAANSWNNMSVASYLTSATFAIRFINTIRNGNPTQSTWQIGSVLLQASNSTDNYRLDIEEQWTNVNYWAMNSNLDIYTGSFSSPPETLSVQWWNATSASWSSLISSLNANSWNNVSVTTYLTSSTFTIRFLDGIQTGDSVQNSWQIGSTLLFLNGTFQAVSSSNLVTIELLQNGTMRWLGQSLQMSTQAMPVPPLPVKSILVNQTINGVNSEVPFQIEDWSSNYLVPLGMTSNSSLFSYGNMIVFLVSSNVSQVTIWWNGSDLATQTPYAFVDSYFTGDNPSAGYLTNGILKLNFTGNFPPVVSSIGSTTCNANFMRINGQASTYGAGPAYIIANGVVRDIVQQEAEWGGGVTNCPNVYSQIVLTLPANATYYTYQLRTIFVQSQQNRTVTDLCPIEVQTSTTQAQTENGTASGYPIVSTATSTFYNQSTVSAHHWSQLISGTNGAGIMFTDSGNNQLYCFDSIAGTQTGGLRVNATAGTIELLPVSSMAPANFTYAFQPVWYGAVSTFSNTTPIYQTVSGQVSGSWISVEYPPTVAVYTEH